MSAALRLELFPADLDSWVDFYTGVLGFALAQDDRDQVDPYVQVRRGTVRIGAARRPAPADADHRQPPTGAEIVVEVDDLDAEYARVRDAGWPVAQAPAERSWGLKDFRIVDPGGYYLRLTTRGPSRPAPPHRVTPDDLDVAVAAAISALRAGLSADWSAPAGDLEWDCRQTIGHIADDMVSYGALVTAQAAAAYPPLAVTLEGSDPAGYLEAFRATAGLLSAALRVAPEDLLVWHPLGFADRSGVAAMGITEVLLHADDLCRGLGLEWTPPSGLAELVLRRLFPHVDAGTAAPGAGRSSPTQDAWMLLRWATGRAERAGYPRVTSWRWYNGHP